MQSSSPSTPVPSTPSPPGLTTLSVTQRLRRVEREAARAALAAYFVHKLGTPLNVLLGRANIILDSPDLDERVIKSARSIVDAAQKMVTDLQKLSNESVIRCEPQPDTDVGDLVGRALDMFEKVTEGRGIEVERRLSEAKTTIDPVAALHIITSKLGDLVAGTGGRLDVSLDVQQVEEPADLRCSPGRYVVVRLERRDACSDASEPPATLSREDQQVARAMGGFLVDEQASRGARAWLLYWPSRAA